MKKKSLLRYLTVASAVLSCFGLMGCDEELESVHTHDLEHHTPQEASCTQDGTREYWSCKTCHKNFADKDGTEELSDTTIAKLGHKMTRHEKSEPTCTADGAKLYYSCERCKNTFEDADGKKALEDFVIPALGHTYSEPVWDWTDYSSAVATVSCTECGEEETATAIITETDSETLCTVEKVYTAKVTFGEQSFTDQKNKKIKGNHTLGELIAENPATCTQPGTRAHYHCSVCDHNFEDSNGENLLTDIAIPALGHTYSEPVWNWTGYTSAVATISCTACGEEETATADITEKESKTLCTLEKVYTAEVAFGVKIYTDQKTQQLEGQHTFGNLTEEIPATCTKPGTKEHHTCSVCKKNFKADKATELIDLEIPAKGHVEQKTVGTPATCTEAGRTDGLSCSVCGATLKRQEEIPALGHSFTKGKCTRCDEISTEFHRIQTVQDLKNIQLSENYILMNDLDLKNEEWMPIGKADTPYSGIFNGNNHVIKNWKITQKELELSEYSDYYFGFFGVFTGEVCDLGVENFAIDVTNKHLSASGLYIGGLAGSNNRGEITNCHATGDLAVIEDFSLYDRRYNKCSDTYLGGLVGVNSGTIAKCSATVDVSMKATLYGKEEEAGFDLGGLIGYIGYNMRGKITDCHAAGKVSGEISAAPSVTYINIYNDLCAGGLVGKVDSSAFTLSNSFATGDVLATSPVKAYAGGLLGSCIAKIKDCHASGDVNVTGLSAFAGGLIGDNGCESITNCFATGDVLASSNPPAPYGCYACAGGLVGKRCQKIISSYATGNVKAESGHSSSEQGAVTYAGGLVGNSGGRIESCHATGDVTANSISRNIMESCSYAGGLVGDFGDGYLLNSYSNGKVTTTSPSKSYIGGLVGFNSSSISYCHATGDVFASISGISATIYAGGLLGWNRKNISNCYTTGTVKATASSLSSPPTSSTTFSEVYVGGLMGYCRGNGTTIKNCYTTGDVISQATSESAKAYAGGLVGFYKVNSNYEGRIGNCFVTGNITATVTEISSSKWMASYAGDIVGLNENNNGIIENCYRMRGQTVKAIQGHSNGTIASYVTAKNRSELQSESFLTETLGWDSQVWEFHEGEYPTLKNME